MANGKRIYVVEIEDADPEQAPRLIEARNQAQALAHATEPFKARLASQDDLVRLVAAGVKVEPTP